MPTQRSDARVAARLAAVDEHARAENAHELDTLVATFAAEAVVLEVVVRGTHTGTWKGIAPTGRRVEFPVCAVLAFDETDRIEAEIVYFDRMTVLAQLGVM